MSRLLSLFEATLHELSLSKYSVPKFNLFELFALNCLNCLTSPNKSLKLKEAIN